MVTVAAGGYNDSAKIVIYIIRIQNRRCLHLNTYAYTLNIIILHYIPYYNNIICSIIIINAVIYYIILLTSVLHKREQKPLFST